MKASVLHTAALLFTTLFLCCSCQRGNVALTEDTQTYTLDNGIVTAVVAKASGDLVSLRYQGREILATRMDAEGRPDLELDPPGANPHGLNPGMTDHQYGFWSHDAMGPRDTRDAIASITVNPARNGHRRAEVSVKGISEGRLMGTGPGAPQNGNFAADIEIRYAVEDGEAKVYTYCIFTHPESYPASSIGEARFCAKLAPMFDWMSVDKSVDFHYPKEHFAGDKYVYTAVQSENPAFGWSSTTERIGCFLLNPSMEYMSGGPTKVEFMGHRDTHEAAAPCILNYWRSSHYGGAEVIVQEGERWEKVIGPFVLYLNNGGDHDTLYADARQEADLEAGKWPYEWVDSPAYAKAAERSSVTGKFVLEDGDGNVRNLRVGLTDPDAFWQRDAKHYQFWGPGEQDGGFTLKNVRPGRYTLRAFADGVLGEFVQTDIEVPAGTTLDLGALNWTPRREGKQVFEIGIPNRNGSEFALGNAFRDPEVVLEYAKSFPKDVLYTVGQSDFRRDWPYLHVPHNTAKDVRVLPFFGLMGEGRATPYRIRFQLDKAPAAGAKATLRLAICGTAAPSLDVKVNGTPAGSVALKQTRDGVITRHGSHGIWYETDFPFEGKRLRKGWNELTLTVPAGSLNSGILYDYLRLELSE